MRNKILKFLASIAICFSASFVGSLFTKPEVDTWYQSIIRPDFQPPNWVFAPVWTVLFLLMGISLYLVWTTKAKNNLKITAVSIFIVQLILNSLWSILFFGLHNPLYSLIEIFFLWVAILASIVFFSKINRTAAYLLIPYIYWVGFASVLNYYIWQLN